MTVGGRGDYYDKSGVLRDMFQNHLLQVLTLVAMEAPARFAADPLRNEKVKVLDAVPVPTPEEAAASVVTGQYAGYRTEKGVRAGLADADVRRRASWRSTTGAGKACRSICAPARRWTAGSARWSSSSAARRT